MVDPTPEPRLRLFYVREMLIFNLGAFLGLVTAIAGGWQVVQVGYHFDLRLFGRTVGAWTREPQWGNWWGILGFMLIGGVLAVGAYLLVARPAGDEPR